MGTLQSDAQLLGNTTLYADVLALHESGTMLSTAPRPQSTSPREGPFGSSGSTFSDPGSADSPTNGIAVPVGRKSSLDGSSARALRRMSTSMRSMIGSMRNKLLRSTGGDEGAPDAYGGFSNASLV